MSSLSLLQWDNHSRRLWSALSRPLPGERPAPRPYVFSRTALRHYLPGAIVLSVVLTITFWVHWRGFSGWPGLINNDEGIYVEQAWAVQYQQSLSPYTYMYDHPMFGWMTIAAYNWVTNSFLRNPTTLIAGREAMLIVHMVSSVFLYLLARRMKLRPLAAGAAVLLFSLSPLALGFQRMVFLDNLAVMWAIIALWVLASPWRSWRSASVGGLCFALAVLSKETAVVLLPGVALMLWDHRDSRNAKMRGSFFWSTFVFVMLAYPLYATIKNELFPGPGHVSLVGAIGWQLVSRTGSGSLLDPNSAAFATVKGWLQTDPVMIGVGTLLVPVALFTKRLRPVAVCLAVQVLMLLRGGYLPFAYPAAMFPFAALVIAGVGDRLWTGWRLGDHHPIVQLNRWLQPAVHHSPRIVVVGVTMAALLVLPSQWGPQLDTAMAASPNLATRQATQYVVSHLPHHVRLVTDNDAWTDLEMKGWTTIPKFNLDLDPAIRSKLKHGYRSIDYMLLTTPADLATLRAQGLPTVSEAFRHSVIVRYFGGGSLVLRKVVNSIPD